MTETKDPYLNYIIHNIKDIEIVGNLSIFLYPSQ